jgi:hypothetical protein
MIAGAIFRGELDQELAEIVSAAITRVRETDRLLTPDRYRRASVDLEASVLQILADKRKSEQEGQSEVNTVLIAATELQALTERLGQYLCGTIEL